MKLDLTKIKVAIFDFDDTLAIHRDKNYSKRRKEDYEVFLNFYKNAYLHPDTFYDEIEVCDKSDTIYKLIDILRKQGTKLYVLSGMKFSFQLKAKASFVYKYYGNDIEVIMARSQERKVDGVNVIQRINNCKLDEILFVDELEENIKRFKQMGINALMPSEVERLLGVEHENIISN